MKHQTAAAKMIRALEHAERANLDIGGETMHHRLGKPGTGSISIATRVSNRIKLVTNPSDSFSASRDIYQCPFSSTDYNPLSPFSVY